MQVIATPIADGVALGEDLAQIGVGALADGFIVLPVIVKTVPAEYFRLPEIV